MSEARIAPLPDRGVVSVMGADAGKLLQGIVTGDVDLLAHQPAIFAGVLSPQGKILFDFLVVAVEGGFLLDVARDKAADLVKRLTMYRLRAKVDIADLSAQRTVSACWSGNVEVTAGIAFLDPRHAGLGERVIAQAGAIAFATGADAGSYHAHRISLGVPEGGKDYDFGDAFPHEANFDLLQGVSFEKGCYVGQEIVARMEHRGTVRKRVVRVTAAADLPATRGDVMMGEVPIGRLGSVAAREGLALLRLDRLIEGIDKGVTISVDGIAIEADAGVIARQRALAAEKGRVL